MNPKGEIGARVRVSVTVAGLSLEEYVEKVKAFHGYAAPGMILGGFMVDVALKHLPENTLYDAICETPKCLPDAIQLLTPCTLGNGWLHIVNLGKFALSLYEKRRGEGVRVLVSPSKLEGFPVLWNWFMKKGPKEERDLGRLVEAICEVGPSVICHQRVQVQEKFLKGRRHRGFAICPRCKESYPADDGPVCLGCQGQAPYEEPLGSNPKRHYGIGED